MVSSGDKRKCRGDESLPAAANQADVGSAGSAAGSPGGVGARGFRSQERAASRSSVQRVAARTRRLVVTIDFGHAGTGYAMEYKGEDAGGHNAQGIRAFATDSPNGAGQTKALTCILLDKDMRIMAFGKEARRIAHEQLRRSQRHGPAIEPFYFFEDFKMRLQGFEHGTEPKVKPSICLPGNTREFVVRDLVQRVYQRNMDQALKKARDEGQLPITEVTWVLTVPAEWSDKARALVRKAADDALLSVGQGVDPPIEMKILMPAEPEAACQMATINDPVSLWETVMIVDCGGGTIDITIHHIVPIQAATRSRVCGAKVPYEHREVLKRGRPKGSKMIDDRFKKMLAEDIFTPAEFQKVSPATIDEIIKDFQDVKHTFGADHAETLAISFGNIIHESEIPGTNREKEDFLNARFRDKGLQMELMGVQLYLKRELVEERLIGPVVDDVAKEVCNSLREAARMRRVPNRIILAGGFSTSPFLQQKLKQATRPDTIFAVPQHARAGSRGKDADPYKQFRTPEFNKLIVDMEPLFTVLKGAVLYGLHHGDRPFNRQAKYAYGIDFDQEMDAFQRHHRALHDKGPVNGNYDIFEVKDFGRFVRNRFSALVKKGDLMLPGLRAQTLEEYTCLDDTVSVKLFQSTNNDAVFVDEPAVTQIGRSIRVDAAKKGDRLKTRFHFGVEGGDRIEVHILVFNPDGSPKADQKDHIEFKFDQMIEEA